MFILFPFSFFIVIVIVIPILIPCFQVSSDVNACGAPRFRKRLSWSFPRCGHMRTWDLGVGGGLDMGYS